MKQKLSLVKELFEFFFIVLLLTWLQIWYIITGNE